ncbi:MAG: hypothetical protein ACE5JR_12770, partial [Gemmatimonadota bacterium]
MPVPRVPPAKREGAYDVFIMQHALADLLDHVGSAPPGERPFGFLVGDLCEDLDAAVRYVLISTVCRSPVPFIEDSRSQITAEAWAALQRAADLRRGSLVGWYHRHASGPIELSEHDLATHRRHFSEPWHSAILVVTDHEQRKGGFFRRTSRGFSGSLLLPFYEVVASECLLVKGGKRTRLDWSNVATEDPVVRQPLPKAHPPSAPAGRTDALAAAADSDDARLDMEPADTSEPTEGTPGRNADEAPVRPAPSTGPTSAIALEAAKRAVEAEAAEKAVELEEERRKAAEAVRRAEAEAAQRAAELEAARRTAAAAARKAVEQKAARRAAELEEERRKAQEAARRAEAAAARQAAELEAARQAAREATRRAAEAEAARKAAEQEAACRAAEEAARKAAEEEEAARRAAELEAARQAAEKEAARQAAEAEAALRAAEQEAARRGAEEEARKAAEEEAAQKAAELETARKAAAEAARKAEEEEAARRSAEAEAARKAEEAERRAEQVARRAEAEAARKAAELEAARRAAVEEAERRAAEAE